MKTLSIREIRSALPHLDELVAEAGEVVVTRRGRPLARILPIRRQGGIRPLTELRAISPRMKVSGKLEARTLFERTPMIISRQNGLRAKLNFLRTIQNTELAYLTGKRLPMQE